MRQDDSQMHKARVYRREPCVSDGTIPASRSAALERVDHSAEPVLENIWNVTNGIAVWKEVPATGTVAIIVEPRAENEVCSDAKEETSSLRKPSV